MSNGSTGIQNSAPETLLGMGSAPALSPMEQALTAWQEELLSGVDKAIPQILPFTPGEGTPTSFGSPAAKNDVLVAGMLNFPKIAGYDDKFSEQTRLTADENFGKRLQRGPQNPNQLLAQV